MRACSCISTEKRCELPALTHQVLSVMNGGLVRTSLFQRKRGERGATMVLFTMLIALVIIPMVGLDGSIAFGARAKLSAAVDAAALAAGRSVNVKRTTNQNTGPVVAVAQQWFSANLSRRPHSRLDAVPLSF
jgi:Flp pilus assembly protein TadG